MYILALFTFFYSPFFSGFVKLIPSSISYQNGLLIKIWKQLHVSDLYKDFHLLFGGRNESYHPEYELARDLWNSLITLDLSFFTRNQDNGAVITRSSQPELGWFGWRCQEDEQLLSAIAHAAKLDSLKTGTHNMSTSGNLSDALLG